MEFSGGDIYIHSTDLQVITGGVGIIQVGQDTPL